MEIKVVEVQFHNKTYWAHGDHEKLAELSQRQHGGGDDVVLLPGARLAKLIFDRNPSKEFFIEQSRFGTMRHPDFAGFGGEHR
jgi:hypothetical protein